MAKQLRKEYDNIGENLRKHLQKKGRKMSHFFCAFVFRETHNVDDAPRGRQKPPLVRVARRRDRLLLPGEARAPPDRADDAVEKSGSSIGGKDVRDVAGNVSRTPRDGGENADGNEMDEGGNGKNGRRLTTGGSRGDQSARGKRSLSCYLLLGAFEDKLMRI